MKLVKMSLLAAALISTSAFAIDNVKVSGDAKLYYSTNDVETTDLLGRTGDSLFSKATSSGQAALGLGLTADLTEGVSAGAHLTALTALGLYNNLVGNVWEGGPQDEYWFDEAWIAGTLGKTTAKVGRMTLDTPLAFTETWSIAKNTFEAAVLLNQDIPDTTLVGAYIGEHNGGGSYFAGVTADWDGDQNTNFGPLNAGKGAYAVGAVNNSWAPLTAQAWFYNLPSAANAYWLQADLAMDFGLVAGVQVNGIDAKAYTKDSTNMAYAAKVGYEMKDVFTVSVAGSQVGENDNGIGVVSNVSGYGQSKLYTEAWWNYGYITIHDTTAINVTATTPEALTWVALGLYATQSTSNEYFAGGSDLEMTEITVTASKSFGPLDASLAYIMTDANDQNLADAAEADSGESYSTVQAYLTYNF